MKIQQAVTTVKKSSDLVSDNYTIDQDNFNLLFTSLRTNLYKYPIKAIVRELTSNAFDSHVEANSDKNVEIEISIDYANLEYNFIVRDWGVGISPKRINSIFKKYFSSTKRKTNNQIGGFGLGSKTPFAYVDSFLVNTFYNGINYKYVCYIDETNLGAISLLESISADRDNGSEIIVPIKSLNDTSLFIDGLKQLKYFKNLSVKGTSFNSFSVLFENEDFVIIKKEGKIKTHVVLGNIIYELPEEIINKMNFKFDSYDFAIGFKFKIGDLPVTLSREDIYYTEEAIKKLTKKAKTINSYIQRVVLEESNSLEYYFDWLNYVDKGISPKLGNFKYYTLIKDLNQLKFQGRIDFLEFDKKSKTDNLKKVFPGFKIKYYRKKSNNSFTNYNWSLSKINNLDIFLSTKKFVIPRSLSSSELEYLISKDYEFMTFELSGTELKFNDKILQSSLEKYAIQLDANTILTQEPASKTVIKCTEITNKTIVFKQIESDTLINFDGIIIVAQSNKHNQSAIRSFIIDYYRNPKISKPIIGILTSPTQVKFLLQLNNCIDIFDSSVIHINKLFECISDFKDISTKHAIKKFVATHENTMHKLIPESREVFRKIQNFYLKNEYNIYYTCSYFNSMLDRSIKFNKISSEVNNLINDFLYYYNKYPLIKFLNSYSSSTEMIQAVEQYIKLIDNYEKDSIHSN